LLADSYNNARSQNRVQINQNNDLYDDGEFGGKKEDDEKLDLLKDIRKHRDLKKKTVSKKEEGKEGEEG